MIWDTSTWNKGPCRPSTTRSARGCHPCLRYKLLPMSPGRTLMKWRRGRDSNPQSGKTPDSRQSPGGWPFQRYNHRCIARYKWFGSPESSGDSESRPAMLPQLLGYRVRTPQKSSSRQPSDQADMFSRLPKTKRGRCSAPPLMAALCLASPARTIAVGATGSLRANQESGNGTGTREISDTERA